MSLRTTVIPEDQQNETEETIRFKLALYRLHQDEREGEPRGPDFMGRAVIITPFAGHYGLYGAVVTVNGSPPAAMVVVTYRLCTHPEVMAYDWSGRARVLKTQQIDHYGARKPPWRLREARVIVDYLTERGFERGQPVEGTTNPSSGGCGNGTPWTGEAAWTEHQLQSGG